MIIEVLKWAYVIIANMAIGFFIIMYLLGIWHGFTYEVNKEGEKYHIYFQLKPLKRFFERKPTRWIIQPFQHDWGNQILIMHKNGVAFARLYYYKDDMRSMYLDMLSVIPEKRKMGLGKQLQVMREDIARLMGAHTVQLWVKKDTWMHEWYLRRGYMDMCDHEDEPDAIWMSKDLNPEKS